MRCNYIAKHRGITRYYPNATASQVRADLVHFLGPFIGARYTITIDPS